MNHKEYLLNQRPQRIPTHPGIILKEDVLPSLGLSITKAAQELGISRQTLHRILNTSHPVTPSMALRFGRFCNNDPAMWLRMQQAYDLKIAEAKLSEELKRIPIYSISLQ
jgi:addiction module HigA family antidote